MQIAPIIFFVEIVSELIMSMKYLAAYLMAVVAEDSHPTKAKVESIIKSIGGEVDKDVLDAFFAKIEGKNVIELIQTGLGKLTSFAAAAPVAAAAGSASPKKGAAAAPKEEKKKEEEEEAGDMGFSLFD